MVKPTWRKALAVTRRGVRVVRAAAGDPKALARVGVAAARRAPRVAAAAAVLFAGGAIAVGSGFGAAPGSPFGAGDQVWTAYQFAASVICHRGGAAMLWPPEVDTQPEGDRIDWRLVAAVGQVSSAHAAGVAINAFGDTLAPLVGTHERSDTDGGRFDGSAATDARVGPLALWPAEIAAEGVDGNFDQIVDPHNVWDAAVTAAASLCVRGAADDPVGALLEWRGDRAWAERVLAAWEDITFQAAAATGPVPWGAPLAYTPRSASGGGPVLAALLDRWAGADTAVTCEGGVCGVKLGFVPDDVAAWAGLLEAGFGAPAAVPNWGFTAAGDPSRHTRIMPWTPGLSWLFPATPPPQPYRYTPPAWWTFTLPPTAAAWTEPTEVPLLRIPTAVGTAVYAPAAGTAEYHAGGCAHIHDQDGALWELCGVYAHPGGTAPPPSGPLQRLLRDWPELERAARLPPPAVLINLGTFSCRTVHDSDTWSPHSWNNAVDIAVDVDGDLDREQQDMDSAVSHDALSRLTAALARTMHNPRTSLLEDGSTLIQDQAPQLGRYQIRNLVFNLDYQPGTAVSVVRHDEHLHVDFWVGRPQPAEPDCAPHEVAAGEDIGVAPGGFVTVAVSGPEGRRLCPQVLFRSWQRGDPLTPAALENELLAEEEAAAEAAEADGDAAEPEELEGCDE